MVKLIWEKLRTKKVPSNKFVKAMNVIEKAKENSKPKPVFSKDPQRARLEKKMLKIKERLK